MFCVNKVRFFPVFMSFYPISKIQTVFERSDLVEREDGCLEALCVVGVKY